MNRALLCLLGLTVVPLVATMASAEIYKWTDADGKVQFSDRPPPGAAPKATTAIGVAPKAAVAIAGTPGQDPALAGVWSVANLSFGGEVRGDDELTASTWTFRDNELVIEFGAGKTKRFAVAPDASASPKAFRVTPLPPTSERPGWMIYSVERGQLKIAFRDNLDGRPTGWQGDRKLTIVTLIPKRDVDRNERATGLPGPDPCEILRSQRVTALVGDRAEETRSGARDAGPACRLEGATGVIALMYVPAARPEMLQAERAKYQKDPRNSIRDEAELGNPAFSSTSGRSTLFVVLRHGTLVMLSVEVLDTDTARRREFTRQVLTRF